MRRRLMVLFLVFLFFGSLIVFMPNAAACHSKTSSVSPSAEQDIIDMNTYKVSYEIDIKLTPGCSSDYYVGFTADPAPTGWSRILYKKGDATKATILSPSAPPDAVVNNWNVNKGWIHVGAGSELHYFAILEVKVTDQVNVENGESATITVNCWSTDSVENELENDPITTITTLNIPHGIRLYHTVAYMATQWTYPGEWAEFDITIKDIGNASGLIDLSKDTTSSPCLEDDWEWEFSKNPVNIAQPEGTARFLLRVKPPLDAQFGDFAMFIVKGVSRADPVKYIHSVSAKTIVTVPLPDLSIKSADMKCLSDEPCDGETVQFSIDVYNIGELATSNFEITFKVSDPGNAHDIGSILVEETLNPNEKITVVCDWEAYEGDHSICIHADEKGDIDEKDEDSNNEAGMIVTVGPAKPKSIILSVEINPMSCMPGEKFTVSGDAKYNKEYNSLPVTETNVQIKIVESDTIFNTKTDKDGKYSKVCTAPEDEGIFTIQVTISKEDISAKKTDYLTVSLFLIDVSVDPRTVITGDDVTISGRVTENGIGSPAVDVTIELTDDDKVVLTETAKTDASGFYSKKITAPLINEFKEYTIDVTATKGEISGSKQTVLYVDIDTDDDNIANTIDEDDDSDKYPDSIEDLYGTDPLDDSDAPFPVADAGPDQTLNEGDEVTFTGEESYSPAGSKLSYLWDLGDDSDLVSGSTLKYTYAGDGEYVVKLTVTDDYEQSKSTEIIVTVKDLDPTVEIEGPVELEEDTEDDFVAKATTVVDSIKSYEWDFGDGETASGESVSHEWAEAGTYTVKLVVTDTDESTAEDSFTIEITAKPGGDNEEAGGATSTVASTTGMYLGIVVIIIVVVLIALFMLMRKKKPTEQLSDGRVGTENVNAQSSRRPTTQFADANIKPAMGSATQQQRMAVPGTVPQRPAVPAQPQQSQLPPAPQSSSTQSQPQEQRDWNWNFNE
jgi:PKD repeat protein